MNSAFLKLPEKLPKSIDPQINTHFVIFEPKKFSFGGGNRHFPNPGHSQLMQIRSGTSALIVNNLPDKSGPALESGLKASLPPVIERIEGTDAHNLFEEQGWAADLDRSFDISYFKKPSGEGRLLDSLLSFNKGHRLHVITFHGLPVIDLPYELLTSLSTYALKDNNCHHASLSTYLQLFKSEGEASPFKVIGELFTAEVLTIMYNQSQLMNVSPSLTDHRMLGLSSQRRSIDLDSVFSDNYQRMLEKIQKETNKETASRNKEELVAETAEQALSQIAPELSACLTTPSHKAENPPPKRTANPLPDV